uniref:Globin family profile domain-containing protein n=1 Tax=Globodera rostochiensis TaxID=31243 RepID=A0A914H6M2_GLORO
MTQKQCVDSLESLRLGVDVSSRNEIQKHCVDSLKSLKLGVDEEGRQNGKDFYKFFFTNYPSLRVYFKGAEKFEAADVQKSERFEKQGQRILLALHLVANVYSDQMVFHAYVRETVAFWTVWTGFLATKMELSEASKSAWMALGDDFAEEALNHLKRLGLPH